MSYVGQNAWSRNNDSYLRVMEMQKAMATQQLGTMGVAPGPGQIGVQSLEAQLHILTFGDSEFKLLMDLEKVPVYNWIHQFNVLSNYGSGVPAAVGAAALPPINNSFFQRGYAEVKFYADLRMIPQQMLDIESAVGNYVGVESRNSLMTLLGKVNHDLYAGNSNLFGFAFDGVETQIKQNFPNNILDQRGGALTPTILEQMASTVRGNWGNVAFNRFYASPAVITPFTVNYIPAQRAIPSLWTGGSGNPFSFWDSQYGKIQLRDDRFSEYDPFNGIAPIQNLPSLPNGICPTPTAAPVLGSPAADSNSQFNAATPGGWYAYCFAYLNQSGISMVSPISANVEVLNGESVTVTCPTAVTPAPSGLRIYRQYLAAIGTSSGSVPTPTYAQMQAMIDIPAGNITTSGTVVTDENADLPGTYKGYFLNTSSDGMHIGQLGDMRKFELAPVNMAYWFTSTFWGMLVCPAPQWSMVVKNIGGTPQQGQYVNAGYAA